MTDETKISLTKKQWKLMIYKMLEKDEVTMVFDHGEKKIKLVKVEGNSTQSQQQS